MSFVISKFGHNGLKRSSESCVQQTDDGHCSVGMKRLKHVSEPKQDGDAANKAYVQSVNLDTLKYLTNMSASLEAHSEKLEAFSRVLESQNSKLDSNSKTLASKLDRVLVSFTALTTKLNAAPAVAANLVDKKLENVEKRLIAKIQELIKSLASKLDAESTSRPSVRKPTPVPSKKNV